MPDRERMRSLLRALIVYLEADLERPVVPALVVSDNQGKLVDSLEAPGEDPPAMSGMLVVGMRRQEFRMLRKAAGLTMAETAHLLKVSERSVLRWEHGASRIDSFKADVIRRELVPGRWAKIHDKDSLSGQGDHDTVPKP